MVMVDCREGGGSVPGGAVAVGPSPPSQMRERFAKVCFETLLQFSVNGLATPLSSCSSPPETVAWADDGSRIDGGTADSEFITGKLAVTALLHRFQEVVEKFCLDQNMTGKCPLPR